MNILHLCLKTIDKIKHFLLSVLELRINLLIQKLQVGSIIYTFILVFSL